MDGMLRPKARGGKLNGGQGERNTIEGRAAQAVWGAKSGDLRGISRVPGQT
jgi:hypothetical protein